MGNGNSGRWHDAETRPIHEGSLRLDISDLLRSGYLTTPVGGIGMSIIWWNRVIGRNNFQGMNYQEDIINGEYRILLSWLQTESKSGKAWSNSVVINTQRTFPHFGGVRYWFTCPRCGRRVRILYYPPNGDGFACRICWKITYKSSNESHMYDRLYRSLAADTGFSIERVKEALENFKST